MRLKTITNKKGEYIVEAAISFPIFFIAIVLMSSIVMMYVSIEDSNYIAATELRRAAIESNLADTSLLLPQRIKARIMENNPIVKELNTKELLINQELLGVDELIGVRMSMRMKLNNPLNLASESIYELSLITRAYVGKERELCPMTEEEMSSSEATAVYVFPNRGEKYHRKNCAVLHAASTATILSKQIRLKYKECPKCNSEKAGIGSLVYIFENDGENYHLPSCETLKRNYIEMTKSVAIRRGYTACLKCGG